MHTEILAKLQEIENKNQIKILYAIESGSRGWGFASQDSDYDVRFLYLHPVEWYLSIETKPDCLEEPINKLLDINGWDLKKALLLFKKSNPPLLEWLHSPIVYRDNYSIATQLRALEAAYFAPVPTLYHYLHIAKNKVIEIQATEQVKLKKYFYILRPLLACNWTMKYQTMPPMEFAKLLEAAELSSDLQTKIQALLVKKIASQESDCEAKSALLLDFFNTEIERAQNYLTENHKTKTPDYQALNQLFQTTLQAVWK